MLRISGKSMVSHSAWDMVIIMSPNPRPTVDDHYFINSLAHIPKAIDIVNRPDAE